jgi:hypothetical protein
MTNPKDQNSQPGRKDSQQQQGGQGNPGQQPGQQGQGREQRPGQSDPNRQQEGEDRNRGGQQSGKPGMDKPGENPQSGQKPQR